MTSMIAFDDSNQKPDVFVESCIQVLKQVAKSSRCVENDFGWVFCPIEWAQIFRGSLGFFRIWTHMGLVQPRFDPTVGVI